MALLTNKTFTKSHILSTGKSFGPFLAIDDENFRFDTQIRDVPIWLGHVASPMCGVLQQLESWTGEWSEEMQRFKQAYLGLLERTKDSLCGQLWLQPFEQPDPKVYSASLRYPAAMIYQYIAVSILDQYADTHRQLSDSIESNAAKLLAASSDLLSLTFINGPNFQFGFEFKDEAIYERFVQALPKAGIHNKRIQSNWDLPNRFPNQPCGNNRCVFQLNFAYRNQIELFWQRLNLVFENFQDESYEYQTCPLDGVPDNSATHAFQKGLQAAQSNGSAPRKFEAKRYLETEFERRGLTLQPVIVTRQNYSDFRERILQMQDEVYEPVRRSPPEEFDMLFEANKPLSIVVLDGEKLAAMSFAGPLSLFTQERGVSDDPFLHDPSVYYSMDLTVAEPYRGGLGMLMKRAVAMLAIDNGVTAIHGRNRDRLAAGMWAINLALGSYELQHLPDDYPDQAEHRDCIYYRCPLKWERQLSNYDLKKLNIRRLLEGIGLNTIALPDK